MSALFTCCIMYLMDYEVPGLIWLWVAALAIRDIVNSELTAAFFRGLLGQ